MTIICAVRDDHGILIGADSLASTHWMKTVTSRPKIFTLGPVVVGVAGSIRHSQVIQRAGLVPRTVMEAPSQYDETWAMALSEHWSKALRDSQAVPIKEAVHAPGHGQMALVACPNRRLWQIHGEGSVAEECSGNGYDAIGCGFEIALGSLFSTKGMLSAERVLTAMRAASVHSTYCGGPYHLARVSVSEGEPVVKEAVE